MRKYIDMELGMAECKHKIKYIRKALTHKIFLEFIRKSNVTGSVALKVLTTELDRSKEELTKLKKQYKKEV